MMRGYAPPRGGYGPPRDPRQYYHQYYHTQGPSPWIPATILGVIVLIMTMPYMRIPDTVFTYHIAVRPFSRFPGAVLWIPVLCVIALQFFDEPWYYGYGGGQASSRNAYNRRYYNIQQQRGAVSTFMDFGGHWLLIMLGIAVFTLFSASSVSPTPVSFAPHWWRLFI